MAPRAKVTWTPRVFRKQVNALTIKTLQDAGKETVAEIKGSFGQGVSSPGQPPGVKSGKLKRNIRSRVDRKKLVLQVGVSADVDYALALELGSPSRNLAPRPYLRPAIKRVGARVRTRLRKAGKRKK